jgi:hypothetical protein
VAITPAVARALRVFIMTSPHLIKGARQSRPLAVELTPYGAKSCVKSGE